MVRELGEGMREIKFRFWDSEFESYVEPVTYFVGFDGSVWFNNCNDGEDEMYDQSEKLVVEQYTGLKDKNGKEIYEGDIVWDNDSLTVVYWEKENCQFSHYEVNDPDYAYSLNEYEKDIYEVVGNIYENKELLGE